MSVQSNLQVAHEALDSLPEGLPMDKKLKVIGAVILPMLANVENEMGPFDRLARTLTELAREELTEISDLEFMMASALTLPVFFDKLKISLRKTFAASDPAKALEKAKNTQDELRRLGPDKMIAVGTALKSVLPATLAAVLIKKTKKEQLAEFNRVMALTPEALAAENIEKVQKFPIEAIVKALDSLEEKLTGPALKAVAHNLANNLTPVHTETLLRSGTGFLRDLFENAVMNKPFTVSDKAQGVKFARSLKETFSMIGRAFEEAGITEDTNLAAAVKKSLASATPKSGPKAVLGN